MTDHYILAAAKPAALTLALLAMLGVSSSVVAQQQSNVTPTAGIDASPRSMQSLGFERTVSADATAAGGASGLPGSSVPMPDGRVTLPRPPGASNPGQQPEPEPTNPPPLVGPPVIDHDWQQPNPDVILDPGTIPSEGSCTAGSMPATPLQNGVNLPSQAGVAGQSLLYSIEVPRLATNLRVLTSGGTGDVTLYVSACRVPAPDSYDEISNRPGNNETVSIPLPRATRYYIRVVGERDFNRVTVQARFTPGAVAW